MTLNGFLQIVVFFLMLLALTKPLGIYISRVMQGKATRLGRWFGPCEQLIYRISRIDVGAEQHWTDYTIAMLLFSVVGLLLLYALQRLQYYLPLNPQALAGVAPDLAFNTAVSFVSNTSWQSYAGESTMSYLVQMAGIATQSFLSAATGIALTTALIRGIVRCETSTIGNFWVDLTRSVLYILLPICVIGALLLVSQGVIQNFDPYKKVQLLEPLAVEKAAGTAVGANQIIREQTVPLGPVASQEIIKQLGSIGGGFFNANSAHPFENPTPFSNFIAMLAILAIPAGLTYTLGHMVGNQKHGWAVFTAMAFLFLAGVFPAYYFESRENPPLHRYGIRQTAIASDGPAQAGGNMEGKEVRFGITQSILHATATTAGSCGSFNSMHDSYTPLAGLIPLFNMMLGEVIFGGVGAGLYGMLLMIILTIFIAGQLVGRTPEYLGKKIEAKEVKMAMLATLVFPLTILVFSAWSSLAPYGVSSISNQGPHGLSEIVYAYTSATGNNGSAFAGLNANTLWYNTTLALAMLIGRFQIIIPMMAIAGSLAAKKYVPASAGTFPVETPLFVFLLIGVILIVGALTFFPALSLGPIIEHLLLKAGKLF